MTHPLLTPRYMVEADYPNSPYKVGYIITSTNTHYDKYPKVFRKMHWSEGRGVSEMPRWISVSYIDGTDIYKVDYFREMNNEIYAFYTDNGISDLVGLNSATPATEAEYLEYLKSKNNESI